MHSKGCVYTVCHLITRLELNRDPQARVSTADLKSCDPVSTTRRLLQRRWLWLVLLSHQHICFEERRTLLFTGRLMVLLHLCCQVGLVLQQTSYWIQLFYTVDEVGETWEIACPSFIYYSLRPRGAAHWAPDVWKQKWNILRNIKTYQTANMSIDVSSHRSACRSMQQLQPCCGSSNILQSSEFSLGH